MLNTEWQKWVDAEKEREELLTLQATAVELDVEEITDMDYFIAGAPEWTLAAK